MTTVLDADTVDARPEASPEAPLRFTPAPAVQTVPDAPAPVEETGFNEAGLRELTGHDWLVAASCGIAGALATTVMSVLFLPLHLMSLMFILGAGLGMLAYLDHCTQLIRNKHNVLFGAAAALLLGTTQVISPASAIIIPALIAAAVSFVFMLGLAVASPGFAGGGDVKLSPIPAALLAAVSPIAAMMWLLFTFVLLLVAMIAAKISGSKRKHVAMAPFMAIAAVMAIGAFGVLSRSLGI